MYCGQINPNILIVGGALIFSILVLLIIAFIFLYQKRQHRFRQEKIELHNSFQREILKTQLETQEQTFHQIGEELHDNNGQLLSSTRMLLGITERSLSEAPDTLRTADQTLAKAIQDLRLLSKSLNKEWLHQFNMLENLRTEIHRINTAKTVEVELISNVKTLPLNPQSQVMLFRIIQEALHNSIKHAEAKKIVINISNDDKIQVSIKDNGLGFDTNQSAPYGVGLLNMNHRTELLGGSIKWHSSPEQGTDVAITVPLQNENTATS